MGDVFGNIYIFSILSDRATNQTMKTKTKINKSFKNFQGFKKVCQRYSRSLCFAANNKTKTNHSDNHGRKQLINLRSKKKLGIVYQKQRACLFRD